MIVSVNTKVLEAQGIFFKKLGRSSAQADEKKHQMEWKIPDKHQRSEQKW